jgi:hypothetical protein
MAANERMSRITAKLYKGMPNIELTDEDKIVVHLELNESMSKKVMDESAQGPISISLESLDVNLQHSQGYGMMRASTGCISSPGGPSC